MEYNHSSYRDYLYVIAEGKLKAFEAEDAKELKIFDDILKKIDEGEKVEIKFQSKILSLTERLYDKFNNIVRICKNKLSANVLKSYIDIVIHMENIIIKKINIGFGSKEDKIFIVYLKKWLKEKIDQLEKAQGTFRDRFQNIELECDKKERLKSLDVKALNSYVETVINMRKMVEVLGKPDDKNFIAQLNKWIEEKRNLLKELGETPCEIENDKENKSIYYGKKIKGAKTRASSLNSYYVPTIWTYISGKDDYCYRKSDKDEKFIETPIEIIKDTIDEKENLKLDDRKEEPIKQFKQESTEERYPLVDSASAEQKRKKLSELKNEQKKLLDTFSDIKFEYEPKYGENAFNDLKREIQDYINKINEIKDLSFVDEKYEGEIFRELIDSLQKIIDSKFPPTKRVCGTFDCLEDIFNNKTKHFKGRKRLKKTFRDLYDNREEVDTDTINYVKKLPFYEEYINSKEYAGLCEFVDYSMGIVNLLLRYIEFSKYAKAFENNSKKFEDIKSYLSEKYKNGDITLSEDDKEKIRSFESFLKNKFNIEFIGGDELKDSFLGSSLSMDLSNYKDKLENYFEINKNNQVTSDIFESLKQQCNEFLNSDDIDQKKFEDFIENFAWSALRHFVDDKEDQNKERYALWESLSESLFKASQSKKKFSDHISQIENTLFLLDKVIKTINPKESKLEEFRFKNGQIIKAILEKLDNYLIRYFSTDYQNDEKIKELKSKFLEVLKSTEFSNNNLQSLLENMQRYLCSDKFLYYYGSNEKIEKFKKSIEKHKIQSELIERTKAYGKTKEYKDLAYKIRKIIDDWTFSLNELIESLDPEKSRVEELKRQKAIICKTMLEKLDDYLIRYQNETEDKRYFQPGFNKLEIKNKDGKIQTFEVEKKMWNIKDRSPYFSDRDVQQGKMGDCWLEATLKLMALKSPDELLKIFPNYLKEVSPIDGSLLGSRITVRLYDYDKNDCTNEVSTTGKFKDISVDTTELTTDDPKGTNGPAWNRSKVLWPHMIEKAVDKFFQEYHYNDKKDYGHQIDGNTLSMATLILTGKSSKYFLINNDDFKNIKNNTNKKNEFLENLLKNIKTTKEKNNVVCGTHGDFYDLKYMMEGYQLLENEDLGIRVLIESHAYTLVGFEENKKEISKTKIHLKNPHAKKEKDEIFKKIIGKGEQVTGCDELTLYLEEFAEYFEGICCT